MPLTYREVLQIGMLLACVPLQYLLSSNLDFKHSSAIGRILATDLQYFKDHWLSPEAWVNSALDHMQIFLNGEYKFVS